MHALCGLLYIPLDALHIRCILEAHGKKVSILIKAAVKLLSRRTPWIRVPAKSLSRWESERDGPPPGYQWNVDILDRAFGEVMSFLDKAQYEHISAQVKELARQEDPTHSDTVDVLPIEEFHEIRDKGGILHKINVRIYFFVQKLARKVVVLGAIKKENDGATAVVDRVRMRRRMRACVENPQSNH